MALSAFPAEEVAHYVHGTLERFSQQAVKVVTQRFDREMRTMGVGPQLIELDYDDGDDVGLLHLYSYLRITAYQRHRSSYLTAIIASGRFLIACLAKS